MRLGNFDCGCDNRKFIMFEAGKLGLTEAAFLASVSLMVLVGWRLHNA